MDFQRERTQPAATEQYWVQSRASTSEDLARGEAMTEAAKAPRVRRENFMLSQNS